MTQSHKRFTDGQVKVLLGAHCQGSLVRAEIQEIDTDFATAVQTELPRLTAGPSRAILFLYRQVDRLSLFPCSQGTSFRKQTHCR